MELKNTGSGLPFPRVPTVIFANWRELLNRSGLGTTTRAGYALAIGGYLDYCRRNSVSVSFESARAYMADAERRGLARRPAIRMLHATMQMQSGAFFNPRFCDNC